ncbi:ABC transporter ATP-binding protein, partial [Streptococcus anginosus]|nr:ABC transporter ATP-binding protein [Streptococcus anginosus]MDK8214079.1 ABC transporter ATP-binding protein [Enterococcus faecalis]
MKDFIRFESVSKVYQDKIVVDHLDLAISSGEFFVLVGPSGSGKTTTL